MKRSSDTGSDHDDLEEEHGQRKIQRVEETPSSVTTKLQCLLPPHPPLSFGSYGAYEEHYKANHVNRCECGKNLPNARFLELHIAENHDSFTAARRDRGEKTYCCFVEDCDKICLTWQKRRMHLVDKHGYPRNYDFFIVNDGIDHRRSLLRRPRRQPPSASASTADSGKASTPEDGEDDDQDRPKQDEQKSSDWRRTAASPRSKRVSTGAADSGADNMDGLTRSFTALQFKPRSLQFGRGSRAGLSRR